MERWKWIWFYATPAERADIVIGVSATVALIAIVAYHAWGLV